MTPTEKFGQMLQMERAALTPALVTQNGIGSAFSQGGSGPATNTPAGWAAMTNAYRQAALASRLKIPIIYGADEVHGIGTVAGATVFPHNIGLGATRDLALLAQIAQITALEAQGVGVDFLFSPVVAVALNERWGRTYEAFGETTDLASTMGVTLINGLQFTAAGAPTGILANAKHYLGDGGTANGANGGITAGDEAALRAIHLEPYRAAVAAHVGSIMASYSTWQTTKMHVNKAMITDTLKGELGFGGFVSSDFDACFQLGLPNTPAGQQDGLGQCVNAGVDMFMLFRVNIPTVLGYFAALVPGTIPQSRIDDAVRRIVAVKCEMGLFASTGMVDPTLTTQVGSAAHRMVARKAVQESVVVLKNDGGVLPLSRTAHVALGGKSADNTGNQAGGWTITWQGTTGNVVPGATSVRQAFEIVLGTAGVTYSATAPSAAGATVGVAVIGETPYAEGKGDSANSPSPAEDVAVVQAMKMAGLKTVVVLIAGRPMLLDTILPFADAIVVAWLPGSEGAGITDILFRRCASIGQAAADLAGEHGADPDPPRRCQLCSSLPVWLRSDLLTRSNPSSSESTVARGESSTARLCGVESEGFVAVRGRRRSRETQLRIAGVGDDQDQIAVVRVALKATTCALRSTCTRFPAGARSAGCAQRRLLMSATIRCIGAPRSSPMRPQSTRGSP